MHYRVKAAHKETGQVKAFKVEAVSPAEAEAKVNRAGYLVSSVKLLSPEHPPPMPPDSPPQPANDAGEGGFWQARKTLIMSIAGGAISLLLLALVASIAQQTARQETTQAKQVENAEEERRRAIETERRRRKAEQDKIAEERRREQLEEEQQRQFRLLTMPVDLDWKRLPEGFKGHDSQLVFNALSKRITPKDSFESSEQYKSRVELAIREKPILANLTVDSIFAFVPYEYWFRYDAETQVFKYFGYLIKPKLLFEDKVLRTYIATNAFGVQVTITKMRKEYVALNIVNRDSFDDMQLQMPSDEARTVAGQLQGVLLCKLIPDYLTKEHDWAQPDTSIVTNSIHVRIIQFWVINTNTGEIIWKIKPWTNDPKIVIQWIVNRMESNNRTREMSRTKETAMEAKDIKYVTQTTRSGEEIARLSFYKGHPEGTGTHQIFELELIWHGGNWAPKAGTVQVRKLLRWEFGEPVVYPRATVYDTIQLRPEYGHVDSYRAPGPHKFPSILTSAVESVDRMR